MKNAQHVLANITLATHRDENVKGGLPEVVQGKWKYTQCRVSPRA